MEMVTARVQERLEEQSSEIMLEVALRENLMPAEPLLENWLWLSFIGYLPEAGRKAPAAGSRANGGHASGTLC